MTETTELQAAEPVQNDDSATPAVIEDVPASLAPFSNISTFEAAQRMAIALSKSRLIPQTFHGNVPDCLLALEIAHRLGVSAMAVLQNIYIVHGKPAFSAKFMISAFNQSRAHSTIVYEWKGEPGTPEHGCRATSSVIATGEALHGPWIDMKLANAEGWVKKEGSKWKTMPDKMLMYRAAAWFIDTHAPEMMIAAPDIDGHTIDVEPVVIRPETALSDTMADLNRQRDG